MPRFTLVIANKTYSSWSMRAWLALRATGQAFDEVVIPLDRPETRQRILAYSPTAKVPCLIDGDVTIWESLAICEYLAERFPAAGLWPADDRARALARAVSAEMHAGFATMRRELPMNCRASFPPRAIEGSELKADIARVQALWADCRGRFGQGGPYLFGGFGIPDAMYAPVVTRFITYGVPIDATSRAYCEALVAHPLVAQWLAEARAETIRIEKYEAAPP
jgi:glutathione S-transferase